MLVHAKLSVDDLCFLAVNSLDKILLKFDKMSKAQILEVIANLRDEIDRYS